MWCRAAFHIFVLKFVEQVLPSCALLKKTKKKTDLWQTRSVAVTKHLFAYLSDLYRWTQDVASCEFSGQNEVVWEFESMKYQPKTSYSKGIKTELCIIKRMPEEMPSKSFHFLNLLEKKPLRGLKPKNVREDKNSYRRKLRARWRLSIVSNSFQMLQLLHFLAKFRHSWGFPLVPVSQATTQIHL